MSTGQGGRWLNEYRERGMGWCPPAQLTPPGPVTSTGTTTRAFCPAFRLPRASSPRPRSLSPALSMSGFFTPVGISLHIFRGAYQLPVPGLSPAMSGWVGWLAPDFFLPSHSRVTQDSFHVVS